MENYVGWATKMQYALACKDHWCHINMKADPVDLLGFPSFLSLPVDTAKPTDAETAKMREWLLKDMKAKELITRRLSSSVASLIPRAHTVFRERLLNAGAPWGETDTIYHMLMGLPQMPIWQQFKSLLEQRMHDKSMTSTLTSSLSFTFDSCVSRITSEAAHHVVMQLAHSSRPGSEYGNAASTPAENGKNSITGLRIHKHNPQGVFCTTLGCNKGDHDHAHCYQKGGGMEGQAPWMRKKKEGEKDTVVAAAVVPTSKAPAPPAPTPPIAAAAVTSLMQDLSFASISEIPEEIACAATLPFTMILDSGTTVNLVKDRSFFHTYSTEDPVDVLTANHGVLQTKGRGTCIAWFTIGQRRLHIRLTNCLHAPGALLNLLSVSCMNAKGWDISFRANMTCDLVYKGSALGSIPATGKLYAVGFEFISALSTPPVTSFPPEFTAFADVLLMLDLWHARIGHIGKEAVMRLPQVAKGVTLQLSVPLSHCESCILTKHPHQPFTPSETECASTFLDLIHSDVCGHIPTITLHGKQYFVIFLDDHTHALDLQLLASKDQALEAWRTLRA
jgi:hypothetical protein